MKAVEIIAAAAQATGYRSEAVVRNYAFADVLDPSASTRKVPLVGFTQTPPSYRSAAFAVVEGRGKDDVALVSEHRALGAPLLFVIDGNSVAVWQVRSSAPPRVIERTTISNLPALFKLRQKTWNPDAIHRAKSVGAIEKGYQLDFVDLGLLPAIEGEIHTKLDRLLVETLAAAKTAQGKTAVDVRTLFRVVFRLLAAKVLQDRNHPYAQRWNSGDLQTVLHGIETYYSLDKVSVVSRQKVLPAYEAAWSCLQKGINFSNVSADDLAFVYENTLVTPEARKLFGTHSTPRQVAEYIVQRLELHRHDPKKLKIYEPFAGAGIFLVSALRHLRNLLPVDWTDQKRHNFLINHLAGDEIDPFACEVACLSLILADYPNHNGWHIEEADLFDGEALRKRMQKHNVILCNPPFESFSPNERRKYQVASEVHSKAVAVIDAAIDSKALALGFVLPRPFILEKQFIDQRRRIEQQYTDVELVELPDRTFGAADIEASILIAINPRNASAKNTNLKSTEISDRDRIRFLKTGEITVQRQLTRVATQDVSGDLWIPPLISLWEYLDSYPRLGEKFQPSRGIEWTYSQTEAVRDNRQQGFRKGLDTAKRLQQFEVVSTAWLDFRQEKLRCNFNKDWAQPKLIMNAARLSRGPWRVAVAADTEGLLLSQQFFGLWPQAPTSERELIAYAAILNGPVANAFMAANSPSKRFRVLAAEKIPMPRTIPTQLYSLVDEYSRSLHKNIINRMDAELNTLLFKIDAMVLEAYDLPPHLERQLLDTFRDAQRPVAHNWEHWDIINPAPGLRLSERVSGRYKLENNWIAEVFRPLPKDEASLLREYGE